MAVTGNHLASTLVEQHPTGGAWTNPSNATIDSSSYAECTSVAAQGQASWIRLGGTGVTNSVPTQATVRSVTVTVHWGADPGQWTSPTVRLLNGSTVLASQEGAPPTTGTAAETLTFTGITRGQLADLVVQVEATATQFVSAGFRVSRVFVAVEYGATHPLSAVVSAESGFVVGARHIKALAAAIEAFSAFSADVAVRSGWATFAAVSGFSAAPSLLARAKVTVEAVSGFTAAPGMLHTMAVRVEATSHFSGAPYVYRDTASIGIPPLPRSRRETWTAHVINPDGTRIELDLDADLAGSLTWDGDGIDAVIHCHGTPPELMTDQRVEIALWVDGQPWRFPPLVPVKDDPSFEGDTSWFTLHLLDETVILAADGLDFARVLPPGSPIVASMRELATDSAPDLRIRWPQTELTLRNQRELALSSAPLDGINALAETINATALLPTLDGDLAVGMWRPAAERPVRMVFGAGETAGYEPRVDMQRFHLEAPNVVHYTASGSSMSGQIVGRWRDADHTSRYSISRRKRRILATGSGDAATQEIADAAARRLGLESRGRGRAATIHGGWQPVIHGHVIDTEHPTHPALSARWEVVSMSVSVGVPSDTAWQIKEVV